ncbi:MAG TPA: BatA domain-containing protein [Phycisphaerae bacterium]|nr:BatA domain-containing protein [Phycisphaerae bacterium]
MFSWLSAFLLNPALAVGAGAVASPILIHLLSKRRLRRVRWAAMDFLLAAYRKNRRRIRLEQLILLMLRCLAVLLIAFMVMRPFLRSGALGALSGLGGRTERIVVIDDSYSTRYVSPRGGAGGQPVFSRLKQAAGQLTDRIAEDSPADSLTLVLTSRPRQPVVSVPSLSQDNVRKVMEQVDALSPTEGVSRMPDALSAIADQIGRTPTQANHAIYVLSDFQRSDWPATGDTPTSQTSISGDAEGPPADRGRTVPYVLIDGAMDAPPINIAITDVSSAQAKVVAGVPARFEVAVANFSDRSLDRVEFSLRTSRHTLPPVLIPTLPAGQTVREPVEVVFGQEGSDYLEARLVGGLKAADGVALDNIRIRAVEVVPAVSVLIVNGEPNTDHLRDETYLLQTALRPAGRAASGNEPTVIEEHDLEVVDLSAHDVVILANVARITAGAQRKLELFVQAGGGLVIFAGDQIDPDFYNERLYNGGRGLLPAAVNDIVTAPAGGEPFAFGSWQSGHPILRDFVDPLAGVLRQVRVYAFLGTRPEIAATTRPNGNSRGEPLDRGVTVLAQFSDADRSPAIVERPFGQGRCLLVTTSVDQEWNDWPASFSYLPLMLKIVQYAARQTLSESNALVGAPLTCPIDPTQFMPRAALRTPAYPVEPEIALEVTSTTTMASTQPAPTQGAAPHLAVVQTTATSRSGVYQFDLRRSSGDVVSRFAAVNPDPRESNLAQASREELEAVFGPSGFEYVRDIGAFTAQAFDPRTELWWPILMAALVILMLEHSLAWWFGTRG